MIMSEFRLWIIQMWHEHCLELEAYKQPVQYTSTDYFKKYKYWLKREFQYRRRIANES